MTTTVSPSTSPFRAIRSIDYTVILVRDMAAMRRFYEGVMSLPLERELSGHWIEYRIGPNILALARQGRIAADLPTPKGSAAMQLAFRVSPEEVDQCAEELLRQGIDLLSPRPTRASATARCSSATPTATCWKSTPRSSQAARRISPADCRAAGRNGCAGRARA